jgi:hypothetical protein
MTLRKREDTGEALDRTLWRARFGRCYGPVARETTERMSEYVYIPVYTYPEVLFL